MEYILNKNIIYNQPTDAFRGGMDAVLLAMATPIIPHGYAMDVGCGSGAVGLIYAYMTDDSVRIQSIEKSDTFYTYAQQNIYANGYEHRMYADRADIMDLMPMAQEKYDIIMTNPPYEMQHMGTPSKNPLKHIAHTETTANLSDWMRFCLKSLKTRGILTMIHKADRLPHILQCLSDYKVGIKVIPIITKHGQDASRVLIYMKKGVQPPFMLKPALVISKHGKYTHTAQKILNGNHYINWD